MSLGLLLTAVLLVVLAPTRRVLAVSVAGLAAALQPLLGIALVALGVTVIRIRRIRRASRTDASIEEVTVLAVELVLGPTIGRICHAANNRYH